MKTHVHSVFYAKTGLLLLATILLIGCLEPIPKKHRGFFSLDIEQQSKEILKYPIDEQIEIYITAFKSTHPVNLGLAYAIASGGERAVPYVVERLEKEEESEWVQYSLIYLLSCISMDHDISKDSSMIRVVERKIDAMETTDFRHRAESHLREILKQGK